MRIPRKPIACILVALMVVVPIYSCSDGSSPTGPSAPKADIMLTGTPEDAARQLMDITDALTTLAKEPGTRSFSVAVGPSDDPVIMRIAFTPDGNPILTRPNGGQAMVKLGRDGFTPVVHLVEVPSGKVLCQVAIEPSVAAKISRGEKLNQTDWIKIGMVTIGGAILAWMGVKAVGLAVVGIGYLILGAIVVGAIVVAGGFTANVFDTMGWSAGDLLNLFRQSYTDLAAMISEGITQFEDTYGLG